MAKVFNLKSFLINTLRRASFRYPGRSEAMKAARIERGMYKCNMCGGTFRNKEIRVDHKFPVVDPTKGFETWDIYISRMFCAASDLQIICETCHDSKSFTEKELRKLYRPKKCKKVKQKRIKD